MKPAPLCFLILAWSISLMAATEEQSEQSTPEQELQHPTEIVIVALGPKPGRRFKESKGAEAPVMLLPQPGEIPPPRLYYKGKSATEKKSDWQGMNLAFNNPSAMREVTPEKPLILYRKLAGDDEYEKYVTIPAGKPGSRRIFFLLPSTTGKKLWNSPPLVRTINLDAEVFSGKQFILKNLSQYTVLHAFADSVTAVPPMKTISYTRPKTGELYRLVARYGTHKKILYNTAVRLDVEGNIQLFALYNASPRTNSGRSVGVFRMMVPYRKPLSQS
ncbi:hypothetical protein JO972_00830 [Verrucomicrobiaceae bacterium 5K15]|uniref:Uncharacterized protein n=1 Tax=Oceaniferula flava TaxID=2800421 RepID=A0AAE2SAV6_9BACT|nr:hypothetical protein [Oceaniferula flavus]MBK1853494.1 hypothetical protein [Oceaniferula flavus]MBM1134799.1 hypothetical protein [Oceaniferula flavus]